MVNMLALVPAIVLLATSQSTYIQGMSTHNTRKNRQQAVAFTAELSETKVFPENDPIIFDSVLIGTGDEYNPETGSFTCPDDDMYLFMWSLHSPVIHSGQDQVEARLMLDEDEKKFGPVTRIQFFLDGEGASGTSQMNTVLRCRENSVIRLLATTWSDGMLANYTAQYTSFTMIKISVPDLEDVAFSTELQEDTIVDFGDKLIYDGVITNEGDAYDKDTGEFLCPDEELYMFTLTVQANQQRKAAASFLFDEATIKGPIAYYSFDSFVPNSGTSSMSIILKCIPGSAVSVLSDEVIVETYNLFQAKLTTFSGFRLPRSVAFSVKTTTEEYAEESENIIYDDILVNEGGHYDAETGEFICPNNGLYFFTWNVQVSRRALSAKLVVNGQTVKLGPHTTYVHYNGIQETSGTASTSAIVRCQIGATVAVQPQTLVAYPVYLTPQYNTFSGFQLQDE